MYKRGEYGQVARALRILDELRGFRHGRALAELAAEVGASERTIKRDIEELIDAGFDIERVTLDGRLGMRLVEQSHSYVARRSRSVCCERPMTMRRSKLAPSPSGSPRTANT